MILHHCGARSLGPVQASKSSSKQVIALAAGRVVGSDAVCQVTSDRPRRRLVTGGDARLELRPQIGRDLNSEVAHALGQAALARRRRSLGADTHWLWVNPTGSRCQPRRATTRDTVYAALSADAPGAVVDRQSARCCAGRRPRERCVVSALLLRVRHVGQTLIRPHCRRQCLGKVGRRGHPSSPYLPRAAESRT
jgi:hypothetical protein